MCGGGGTKKKKKMSENRNEKNTTRGAPVHELMRYGSGDGTIQRAPPSRDAENRTPFFALVWLVCMIARMLMPCSKKFLEA